MDATEAFTATDGWHTPFGNGAHAYEMGGEFYLYDRNEKLIRVCPSIGMAREIAAGL